MAFKIFWNKINLFAKFQASDTKNTLVGIVQKCDCKSMDKIEFPQNLQDDYENIIKIPRNSEEVITKNYHEIVKKMSEASKKFNQSDIKMDLIKIFRASMIITSVTHKYFKNEYFDSCMNIEVILMDHEVRIWTALRLIWDIKKSTLDAKEIEAKLEDKLKKLNDDEKIYLENVKETFFEIQKLHEEHVKLLEEFLEKFKKNNEEFKKVHDEKCFCKN